MMNRKTATAQLIALVSFMVLVIGSFPVPAFDVVTIVGVVNGTSQIVADEEVYEVDDTPRGNDLVKNYIGQKVKVTGKLRIEGDMRVLDVTKFEVVKEVL
jgi:hypothetical protein